MMVELSHSVRRASGREEVEACRLGKVMCNMGHEGGAMQQAACFTHRGEEECMGEENYDTGCNDLEPCKKEFVWKVLGIMKMASAAGRLEHRFFHLTSLKVRHNFAKQMSCTVQGICVRPFSPGPRFSKRQCGSFLFTFWLSNG